MTKYKVKISNRGNTEYEVHDKRPILDELRKHGLDLPYGCKYGGCITCAAKLTAGNIDQRRQVALNNWQLERLRYFMRCEGKVGHYIRNRYRKS